MLTRCDSLGLAELESAHCYAAEFGSVLEWCAQRTNILFDDDPSDSALVRLSLTEPEPVESREERAARLTPWDRAAEAYSRVREARRVERRFSGEVA